MNLVSCNLRCKNFSPLMSITDFYSKARSEVRMIRNPDIFFFFVMHEMNRLALKLSALICVEQSINW